MNTPIVDTLVLDQIAQANKCCFCLCDSFITGTHFMLDALRYASPALRDNRYIVKWAVAQNWRALEFASAKLRDV